ncbi:hypothetical protein Tco_0367710 [Tanacetum coccineum]
MKGDPLLQTTNIALRSDDPHDDAHPEGENSAKRQKTSEYEAYVSGESSSGQDNVEEPVLSTFRIPHAIDLLHKETKEPGRTKEETIHTLRSLQVIKTF